MIKALAITGPTASGKTAVSIEVAKALSGEIISCDSMQIYREMNIGTAKATEEERREVPHHMLDFLSPTESYSAEAYRADAMKVAGEISERGKLPIFVGGTGLYIDTLLRADCEKAPESSPEFRQRLLDSLGGTEDADILWQRLFEVDRESAETIHKNNVRRVIRALEIYERTGKPKSYFDKLSRAKNNDIEIEMITLDFHDRENLYSRVNARVDEMLSAGLLAEVCSLYERGMLRENTTAAQAIGYKEIICHIKGEVSLEEAVENLKLSTRRYAKRQLTWFRHEEFAYRLYIDDENGRMRDKTDIISEAINFANKIQGNTNEIK